MAILRSPGPRQTSTNLDSATIWCSEIIGRNGMKEADSELMARFEKWAEVNSIWLDEDFSFEMTEYVFRRMKAAG